VNKAGQSGFTLIEVLISVFVLALGVVGVAGMQLVALRTSQQSSIQSMAAQLATEMADKMRANPEQMKLDDNLNPYLNEKNVVYSAATDPDPEAPSKMCYSPAVNCSSAELAAFDIYEWKSRLKAVLPGGRVAICRDASPWDSVSSALTWACSGVGAGNTSLVIKIGWQGKNPDGSLIKDADGKFPPNVAIAVEPYVK
jgi:type IV pilus assembly protein PilV